MLSKLQLRSKLARCNAFLVINGFLSLCFKFYIHKGPCFSDLYLSAEPYLWKELEGRHEHPHSLYKSNKIGTTLYIYRESVFHWIFILLAILQKCR